MRQPKPQFTRKVTRKSTFTDIYPLDREYR